MPREARGARKPRHRQAQPFHADKPAPFELEQRLSDLRRAQAQLTRQRSRLDIPDGPRKLEQRPQHALSFEGKTLLVRLKGYLAVHVNSIYAASGSVQISAYAFSTLIEK